MRLEVGHIFIKDIQFGTESKIEDGVLYVSERLKDAEEFSRELFPKLTQSAKEKHTH